MTDELTPVRCGCGGEANIYTYEARWKITEDGYQRSVGCLKCGIATQLYDTEAEAITAWNRAMGADQFREVTKKIERTAKDEYIAEIYRDDIVSHYLSGMC